MLFVYKPEGTEDSPESWRKWSFEPDRILASEAKAIEKVAEMTFGEWIEAFQRASMTAIHAFLWVMLKRTDPTLRPEAVDFTMREVDFELTDDEVRARRDELRALAAFGPLSTDDAAVLAQLEESDVPDLPAAEDDEEQAPKA